MARSSILAPHRLVIVGVVGLLAVVTVLFLRGPAFWQRWYYPLPGQYAAAIRDSSARHEVNPYLVAAVIECESNWKPDRVSKAGAVGLMQVLPATAKDLVKSGAVDGGYASRDLADPAVSIEFGAAYLRFLVERYHEIEPALAAYNAGMGNVDEWVAKGGNIRDHIEFPETRHYVLRVMRARDVYQRLYPDAFQDGSGR